MPPVRSVIQGASFFRSAGQSGSRPLPGHPAILRLIKMVIEAAHKEGKWVGMCGEMAGDSTAIPLLLGLGLDEFSMSATSSLPARSQISKLSQSAMQELAAKALDMQTAAQVVGLVNSLQA